MTCYVTYLNAKAEIQSISSLLNKATGRDNCKVLINYHDYFEQFLLQDFLMIQQILAINHWHLQERAPLYYFYSQQTIVAPKN